MRKFINFIVIAVLLITIFIGVYILLFSSSFFVISSLGKKTSKEFYTSGGFQDYTDYAKYQFKDAHLDNNPYFKPMTEESMDELNSHIDNFEGWVGGIGRNNPENELIVNYDFDRSIISMDDYVYIYDNPDYQKYGSYNIYFFDVETQTLFYFHNNI